MAPLSRRKRASLPASDFACPTKRAYPINDAPRVRAALARYDNPKTEKCRGGRERILKRARKLGVEVRR